MPNEKGEHPKIYSFNLRRELGAKEDPRPTDEIAADIVKKYGEDLAVLAKLTTMGTDLDRFNTPEDIEPFLRGQSLIGTTPEVYLALARKWQALTKLKAADERGDRTDLEGEQNRKTLLEGLDPQIIELARIKAKQIVTRASDMEQLSALARINTVISGKTPRQMIEDLDDVILAAEGKPQLESEIALALAFLEITDKPREPQ